MGREESSGRLEGELKTQIKKRKKCHSTKPHFARPDKISDRNRFLIAYCMFCIKMMSGIFESHLSTDKDGQEMT